LAGAEGSNGEWDDLRDFAPTVIFVDRHRSTGFVHARRFPRVFEEYELYRGLGMLEPG